MKGEMMRRERREMRKNEMRDILGETNQIVSVISLSLFFSHLTWSWGDSDLFSLFFSLFVPNKNKETKKRKIIKKPLRGTNDSTILFFYYYLERKRN